MTPAEARQQWYQEMAGSFGELSAQWADVERRDDFAASRARLAAHFGRLALGQAGEESWARRRFRQELWINHGCGFHALYGDDGEMQCNACHVDFKREPLEEIVEFVEFKRLKRVADALTAEASKP